MVYGSVKNAINKAVPEAAEINERLSNLLAARNDLETLTKAEEVGRGTGVIGGKIGKSVAGYVESGAGRVVPAAGAAKSPVGKVAAGVVAGAASKSEDDSSGPISDQTPRLIEPQQ